MLLQFYTDFIFTNSEDTAVDRMESKVDVRKTGVFIDCEQSLALSNDAGGGHSAQKRTVLTPVIQLL